MSASFEKSLLEPCLKDYYKSIFPFKPYTKWLCYGQKSTEYFSHREFAFILDGDIHMRHKSFPLEADFEKQLCSVAPHKLDLGAVYNRPPREKGKYPDYTAVERELVFDIDLTDYEGVRTCCKEAKVCAKCWRFVALAVKILDKLLCDDFGFQARMWVFSGRRGVHCWIGDVKARKLDNIQRSAVAEYLSLFAGEKMNVNFGGKKQPSSILHPMVETAYKTALNSGIVEKMVLEQGWLEDSRIPFLMQKIDDEETTHQIRKAFDGQPAETRWHYLVNKFDIDARRQFNEKKGKKVITDPPPACENFLKWFVLYHVYPRLDVNVSTGVNHLLKSPFCVHPATGCIAVPLDVASIENFDTSKAPRIDLLLKQLREDSGSGEVAENRKVLGYKHTDLAPYVVNFERFVEKALANAAAAQNGGIKPRN